MFGFRFVSTLPTTYVMHFRNGAVRRQGAGLSFFYYQPGSTIVMVPLESADLPFVFHEVTADFQEVTVQGQITYRIVDAPRLASLLDFSVDHRGRRLSEDPEAFRQRLVQATQVSSRHAIQRRGLRQALKSLDAVADEVQARLRESTEVGMLGVEVIAVVLTGVSPSPEMARALEAEAREALSREADLAIYERRHSAIEQERRLRESELNTEIAIEEKKRGIREKKIGADIAIEQRRSELVDRRVKNEKKSADARAYALEASIAPLRELDWKTLMALSRGGGSPDLMIATAFRELAENAGKIGELNVSPELLVALTRNGSKAESASKGGVGDEEVDS